MLLKYSFANFQSFLSRAEVDLTLNRKTTLTDWMVELSKGERVSKLMTVIGANGSGKTSLLKPLAFLNWFMAQSFQNSPEALIPFSPHFSATNKATEFEVVLNFDDHIWRYELICTPQRVLHEALYQKRERFGYIFVRDWDEKANQYRIKQRDFGFSPKEASKVRPNASLISTAAQYGVPLATRLVAPYVITNISIWGRLPVTEIAVTNAAQYFSNKSEQYKQMVNLLSAWDLGLSGVDVQETEEAIGNLIHKAWRPFGIHKCRDMEYRLPFLQESSGTRGAFVLLSLLLPTLEIGGLAVIDEFENDLHPHMLEPILELFANPRTNPHNAQLLFSCHATEVLKLVDKSQVMLVQKNSDCESEAIRLDAIEGIRSDDNFCAKYMAGAYGAIPNF